MHLPKFPFAFIVSSQYFKANVVAAKNPKYMKAKVKETCKFTHIVFDTSSPKANLCQSIVDSAMPDSWTLEFYILTKLPIFTDLKIDDLSQAKIVSATRYIS